MKPLTCVGSGCTGTEFDCDSRDSGWTETMERWILNNEFELVLSVCWNLPGGQTICGASMFWAGFIGCADTMAGSMGCPSYSNMESWQQKGSAQRNAKQSKLLLPGSSTSPAWSCRVLAFEPWGLAPLASWPGGHWAERETTSLWGGFQERQGGLQAVKAAAAAAAAKHQQPENQREPVFTLSSRFWGGFVEMHFWYSRHQSIICLHKRPRRCIL